MMCAVLLAGPANAQTQQLSKSLAGFATDPNAPIRIEAAKLRVDDNTKKATFTGNVVAAQGDFVMRSSKLVVSYSGEAGGQNSQSEVTRLNATGKVLITSTDARTAKGEKADFDVRKQIVVLTGNVVLTQGKNVMKGEKLLVDLKSGLSTFEASTEQKPGRIQVLLHRPQKKKGTKP